MLFVRFNLFCLLSWVLVYILIKVTSFLRNERFVYIFNGEKTMPVFGKTKFVCTLMHFERDDAVTVATGRCIKTNEFTCIVLV